MPVAVQQARATNVGRWYPSRVTVPPGGVADHPEVVAAFLLVVVAGGAKAFEALHFRRRHRTPDRGASALCGSPRELVLDYVTEELQSAVNTTLMLRPDQVSRAYQRVGMLWDSHA